MTASKGSYVIDIRSLNEAMEFARLLAATEMVPETDRTKPGNILAKMQIGAEIGLPPMQAINTLYVQKGRVGMEVKSMLALIEASGLLEEKTVAWDGPEPQTGACIVTVKRVGRKPYTVRFGEKEALKAGLKGGNKDTYTKWDWRMFYNRAMGFALQDEFQDVLRGTVSVDYLRDSGVALEPVDVPDQVDGAPTRAALPPPDPELEAICVTKMNQLQMRPGARLAKLTEYRGRVGELLKSLDAQLAVAPTSEAPKTEPPKTIDVKPEPPAPSPAPAASTAPTAPTALDEEADRFLSDVSDADLDAEILALDARR